MLHGFMQDEKWYEDLGHIVLGFLPIDLLLWVREFTRAKLPWPFKGQYPPGWPFNYGPEIRQYQVTQMSSVEDLARDQLGYAIGQQLRVCLLVGLLWWRW